MADIEHAIQITAPPETIYPLISTGKGFSEWWAQDITESAGTVELGFFKRSTVYVLRLEDCEVPARAEWLCETGKELAGTHIVFRMEARGASTFLRFSHLGWPAATEYFISCNTTRGELMFRLKSAAEGKSRGPLFRTAYLAY